MNTTLTKTKKALTIALVALQIPMLMLWKIAYDSGKLACHEIEIISGGGYTLVFQKELLGKAILASIPFILPLLICFVLSILSLILLLKRKDNRGITRICFNAISLVACGVLICFFAFSFDLQENNLGEYMFFRYFMGSEFNLTQIIPFWKMIKYIIVGFHAVANGVLFCLGIARLTSKKD